MHVQIELLGGPLDGGTHVLTLFRTEITLPVSKDTTEITDPAHFNHGFTLSRYRFTGNVRDNGTHVYKIVD
jgi:hypothetical protein